MKIIVDKDLCSKCNTCATVCLMQIIQRSTEYKPLKDFINLPDGRRLAFAMLFGYSKYKITSIPRRNKADVTWK